MATDDKGFNDQIGELNAILGSIKTLAKDSLEQVWSDEVKHLWLLIISANCIEYFDTCYIYITLFSHFKLSRVAYRRIYGTRFLG